MKYGIQGMRPDGRINFDLTSRFSVTVGKIRVPSFYYDGQNVSFREDQGGAVVSKSGGTTFVSGVNTTLPKSRRYEKNWVTVYNPVPFYGWDSPSSIGQYIMPFFSPMPTGGQWRIMSPMFNNLPGYYGGFDIYIGYK